LKDAESKSPKKTRGFFERMLGVTQGEPRKKVWGEKLGIGKKKSLNVVTQPGRKNQNFQRGRQETTLAILSGVSFQVPACSKNPNPGFGDLQKGDAIESGNHIHKRR